MALVLVSTLNYTTCGCLLSCLRRLSNQLPLQLSPQLPLQLSPQLPLQLPISCLEQNLQALEQNLQALKQSHQALDNRPAFEQCPQALEQCYKPSRAAPIQIYQKRKYILLIQLKGCVDIICPLNTYQTV